MSEQAEMIKIAWSDVRAGDVLMHENGDRLTVVRGGEVIVEAVGHELATDAWAHMGFTPYRKAEPLPTTPGAYLDKVRAEAFGQGVRSAIDAVNTTGNHAPLVKAYLRKAEQ